MSDDLIFIFLRPLYPAGLKKICKAIAEARNDEERVKAFGPLQEMITFVQFANDECDYGMGYELGIDLFCFGSHVSLIKGCIKKIFLPHRFVLSFGIYEPKSYVTTVTNQGHPNAWMLQNLRDCTINLCFPDSPQYFHKVIKQLLPMAYSLLKRSLFGEILEAHLCSRSHDDLDQLSAQ